MKKLMEQHGKKKNLKNKEIKVIDATWHMPSSELNAFEIFKEKHIPGSIYIDLEEISDPNSELPHMMPNEDFFSKKISSLGIENSNHLVIYDMYGMFSAARIWFMFKAFGHEKISILNGGFPAWINSNGEISNQIEKIKETKYKATLNKSLVVDYQYVLENISKKKHQIIDARSPGRFLGIDQEPRPDMKSGHIPNSKNLFFNDLIDQNSKKIIEKNKIEDLLKSSDIDKEKDIIWTCGSGVTACILKFAIELVSENKNIKIYDGSWSEWGTIKDSPCEKN